MEILQSLNEQLEPVIAEIIEELDNTEEPYVTVIDRWMELIREIIAGATVEYNTDWDMG